MHHPVTSNTATTAAIIVTFHPCGAMLVRLLERLALQVDAVYIIDNTPGPAWPAVDGAMIRIIHFGTNKGIATAHNCGIDAALRDGHDFVLLLDQDSLPAPDMVEKLHAGFVRLKAEGVRVAAVGPNWVDARMASIPPFPQVRRLRLETRGCAPGADFIECDYLISSGSLMPATAFERVGLMRESLFIDYVDIEWGLRARSRGFRTFGICAAVMHHEIGHTRIKALGRAFQIHTPIRHYYMVRNAVWLYCHTRLPLSWKVANARFLLKRFVAYSLFAKPRLRNLGMMTLGAWHGLIGRLGPR